MNSSAMVSSSSIPCGGDGISACVSSGLIATLALLALALSASAAQEIPMPGQRSLSEVVEIRLTYTDASPLPSVALGGRQPSEGAGPSSYRPVLPILDLLAGLGGGRAFGACDARQEGLGGSIRVKFSGFEGQRCGLAWSLRRTGKPLDALSYDRLRLRGVASGEAVIALSDLAREGRQDNVPVARVSGSFNVEVPLAVMARRLHLQQLTAVMLLADRETDLTLEEASLQSSPPASPAPAIGFWMWDYHRALEDPGSVMASCLREGCRRLLLQMPDLRDADSLWTAYARLFPLARAAQIELFALDGYSEAIQDPGALADKVNRLLSLMDDSGPAGIQLDIEPYLLPDFDADETGFNRYLAAIDHVKAALNGRGGVSVVMPFWFTSRLYQGRPIASAVMDRADEVAVMSYRTDVEDVLMIGEDMLRYGRLAGVPIWLALETTRLPVERHVVLRRESRPELADGFLDEGRRMLVLGKPVAAGLTQRGEWFRIHHRFTVLPERITFAGRSRSDVRTAVRDIFARPRPSGLAGGLIHDLAGYQALRE